MLWKAVILCLQVCCSRRVMIHAWETVVGGVWEGIADREGKVFFKAVRTILIHIVTVTLPLILSWYIIDKLFTMYIRVEFIRLDTLSSVHLGSSEVFSFPFYICIYFSFSWHWEKRECKANCLNLSLCS